MLDCDGEKCNFYGTNVWRVQKENCQNDVSIFRTEKDVPTKCGIAIKFVFMFQPLNQSSSILIAFWFPLKTVYISLRQTKSCKLSLIHQSNSRLQYKWTSFSTFSIIKFSYQVSSFLVFTFFFDSLIFEKYVFDFILISCSSCVEMIAGRQFPVISRDSRFTFNRYFNQSYILLFIALLTFDSSFHFF